MLRLLTILSMPQTTVERFGLLCLLQHVEESPFYNFVHNLQIGQYIFLAFKERIEANKRIVAEREREKEKSRQHNRGMSR